MWWLCDVDFRLRSPKLAASVQLSKAARACKVWSIRADVCAFCPEVEDFKDLG